jgi:predicted outer membrane lipoprotein
MTDTIIGGVIAGAVGIIIAFWVEHRRDKAQRLAIVDALIIETSENLVICKDLEERRLWWTALFNLEAYDAYKHQPIPLPEQVRSRLVSTALVMRNCNTIYQALQQAAAYGQDFPTQTMPPPKELIEQLEFVNKELRKWKAEHARSLGFRIARRLRHFLWIIRKNSRIDYT